MNRNDIVEGIKKIIESNLELEIPADFHEGLRTWEDLGVDSIMAMQLVVYIEEDFGIEVPEDDIDITLFETIGSLTNFIEKQKKAAV